VLLLALGKTLSIDISLITYILALFIITINSAFFTFKYKYFDRNIYLIFISMVLIMIVNIIINNTGAVDAIKIIGTQMFFFVGSTFLIQNKLALKRKVVINKLLILMGFPITVLVLQILNIIHDQSSEGPLNEPMSSIFVNKNNAVVYFITLSPLLYFLKFNKKIIILYLILIVILFKTLGAVSALFLAWCLIYFRPTLKSFIYIIFMVIVISFFAFLSAKIELPIVERLINAYTLCEQLLDNYSFYQISEMSFGDVALMTGSADISLFFRIIHWIDIFTYYCNAPLYNEIFGIGLGNIQNITKLNLVAHNDWLKILVELGLFYFILFFTFIVLVFKKIVKRDRLAALFFFTVLIYFISENIMGNFIAMSFFYYFLGINYAKSKNGVH